MAGRYAMLCLLLARGAALRKVVVERDVIIVPEGSRCGTMHVGVLIPYGQSRPDPPIPAAVQ